MSESESNYLHIINANMCGGTKFIEIPSGQPSTNISHLCPHPELRYCGINYNGTNYNPYTSIPLKPTHTIHRITIIPRSYGGGFGISMDDIIDGVLSSLSPVIAPIQGIASVFVLLLKLLLGLVKLIVWLIQFALWFLIDFCNPVNLATDFIGGIMKITRLIFVVGADAIFGALKYMFNTLLSPIFSGFWGWDNVISAEEKARIAAGKGSADVKAYVPAADGSVPFTVILATVLLPPMGVFMEFGLASWINIIICAILTMAYYIPGLIYALVLIYS
jgi:uncharacterized membrane protein YqaE (UPF0057 family)